MVGLRAGTTVIAVPMISRPTITEQRERTASAASITPAVPPVAGPRPVWRNPQIGEAAKEP
jgi:hypothetical protein